MTQKNTACALLWTSLWALSFAVLGFFTITLTDGQLIYSIDDPLIHLSIAKNILLGGYGVNFGEFSSPSSSILYPFLLAGLLPFGTAAPLIVNSLAAGFSVWLLLEFFWRYAGAAKEQRIFVHLASPLLIIGIDAYALPWCGMENMLQVLLVIIAMRGMIAVYEQGRMPGSLGAALLLMPFVRFENLAFSAAALVALAWYGRRRAALGIGAAILAGLLFWCFVMHRLGLPLLPGSVLVKSEFARSVTGTGDDTGFFSSILHTVYESFAVAWGYIFTLAAVAMAVYALRLYRRTPAQQRRDYAPEFMVVFVTAVTLMAQVVFGRSGWFMSRYETYAAAAMILGSLYVVRDSFSRPAGCKQLLFQAALLITLAGIDFDYGRAAYLTPYAARNMYEQQYQMQRFNRDFYPHRVAINDLGWVSYGSDHYVLDLWGLGSEPVRRMKMHGPLDAEALRKLAATYGIDYAMIYDDWFKSKTPPDWCRVAILYTPAVSAGSAMVSFYATNIATVPDINQALDRFAPTLPARDNLTRLTCGHSYAEDIRTVYVHVLGR